ncbi:MAG: hypothetical protein HPM95_08130 [Alphaproteobacteria bacterium]|nr:hypothetical protein [Alphaproteobacteria bacterium]
MMAVVRKLSLSDGASAREISAQPVAVLDHRLAAAGNLHGPRQAIALFDRCHIDGELEYTVMPTPKTATAAAAVASPPRLRKAMPRILRLPYAYEQQSSTK